MKSAFEEWTGQKNHRFGVHVDPENPDWEFAQARLETELRNLGIAPEIVTYHRILAYDAVNKVRVRRLEAEVANA